MREGKAHRATTFGFVTTLCGVSIPKIVSVYARTGRNPAGGATGSVFVDDADDTARKARCRRCEKLATTAR